MDCLTEEERANMFAYFDFDSQFVNMYRSGQFYARTDYNKFSLVKLNDQFMNFRSNVERVHRGNEADRNTGLIKNEALQTVQYADHISSLLASSRINELNELALPIFFNGQAFGNKVAYASYSRSGNTFFRKYLE